MVLLWKFHRNRSRRALHVYDLNRVSKVGNLTTTITYPLHPICWLSYRDLRIDHGNANLCENRQYGRRQNKIKPPQRHSDPHAEITILAQYQYISYFLFISLDDNSNNLPLPSRCRQQHYWKNERKQRHPNWNSNKYIDLHFLILTADYFLLLTLTTETESWLNVAALLITGAVDLHYNQI